MNILLLGSSNTIFMNSYIKEFLDDGHNVFFASTNGKVEVANSIDISDSVTNKSRFRKYASKFKIDRSNFFWYLIENREYRQRISSDNYEKLKSFVSQNSIDCVFCFWGTTLKKEVFALKNIRQELNLNFKMVLAVNTYPVRYDLPKQYGLLSKFLLSQDKSYFDCFDRLLCSTNLMVDFFSNNLGYSGKVFFSPDFLHESFICDKDYGVEFRRSVIFLGNVDFNNRTLDDVSNTIIQLANSGIDVYVQSPCKIVHERIKTFRPFTFEEISNGELGRFINKFTAVLVAYNDLNNLRTAMGYPTRFALATLGLRPILIPCNVFSGLESNFTEQLGHTIFTYSSISEVSYILDEIDKNESYVIDDYACFKRDFFDGYLNMLGVLND